MNIIPLYDIRKNRIITIVLKSHSIWCPSSHHVYSDFFKHSHNWLSSCFNYEIIKSLKHVIQQAITLGVYPKLRLAPKSRRYLHHMLKGLFIHISHFPHLPFQACEYVDLTAFHIISFIFFLENLVLNVVQMMYTKHLFHTR